MDWGLALSTTATGLIVVFAVLIILIFAVYLLGKVMTIIEQKPAKSDKKSKKAKDSASAPSTQPLAQESVAVSTPQSDEGVSPDVVAAISGALSVILSAEGKPFRIKSIKRAKDTRPAWNAAGIQENTRPF